MRRNNLDAKAAEHLAGALKENQTLTTLKYAAASPSLYCQQPLTVLVRARPRARRVDRIQRCGLDYKGSGTYTAEGIIAITEMLKVNTTLQSIGCASLLAF